MTVDPFRLRCVTRLQAIIAAIVPDSNSGGGNGYRHDLTAAVFLGRTHYSDDDPVPMASILELPLPIEKLPTPPESPINHGDWDLVVQGWAEDDKDNPLAPAYRLSADVISALATEKKRPATVRAATGFSRGVYLLGEQGVRDLLIGSPVHRPPDEISSKAYFWLPITIKTVENLEDPYGQ